MTVSVWKMGNPGIEDVGLARSAYVAKASIFLLWILYCAVSTGQAGTNYWDTTAGAGLGVGGTGTWTAQTTAIFSVNSAGSATLTAAATTDDNVFQGTAGTITLGFSPTANSFTFNTTGYIVTAGSATTRTLTGPVTLNGLNSVNLTFGSGSTADRIFGVGSVTGGSGSTLTINGSATGTNATRLNVTSIAVPITVSGTGLGAIAGSSAGNTVTGTVTGSGARLSLGAANSADITFSNTINNGTGAVRIALGYSGGAGTVIISSTGNTWGATELNNTSSGILQLGVTDALPTSTTLTFGAETGNGNSTVDLRSFSQTIGQLTNGAQSGGTITNGTSSSTSTLTISGSDTSAAAYSGIIQNGSGTLALVRSGNGSTTLSSTNAFTGGTTVSGGTLVLGHATDTLANGGAVTVSGGNLSLGANSDTVGVVTLTSGSITSTSGTLTGSGGSYDFRSGTVSAKLGGPIGLSKTTGGIVTLSGANAYSGGTTVSGGRLEVNNVNTTDSGTGSAGVTINSGGTVRGTGAIGGTVAVTRGGKIGAGTGSATAGTTGVLTTGAQTWSAGGTYQWRVSDPTKTTAGSTSWDQLNVASETNAAAGGQGNQFTIDVNYIAGATPADQPFTIPILVSSTANSVQFDASKFVISVSNAPDTAHGDHLNYSLGQDPAGDDLELHYTPEPSCLMLPALPLYLLRRPTRPDQA